MSRGSRSPDLIVSNESRDLLLRRGKDDERLRSNDPGERLDSCFDELMKQLNVSRPDLQQVLEFARDVMTFLAPPAFSRP